MREIRDISPVTAVLEILCGTIESFHILPSPLHHVVCDRDREHHIDRQEIKYRSRNR